MSNLKACKLCPNVTKDARYVEAIDGWKCDLCSSTELDTTGKFDVAELRRQAQPVDFNPVMDNSFIIKTTALLEDL